MSTAERKGIALAGAAFLAWSGAFVLASSFVALDGRRYFCLFDDAMISMRYAWNLTHGAGLVWNPGERVEGYTSLLMTLLMGVATGTLDKVRAVAVVQLLGALTALGVALAASRLSRLVYPGQPVALTVGVASLAYYPLAYWSVMGMETGLLALWVTGALSAALKYDRTRDARQLWTLAGALALAFLTRPDALLLGLPTIVYAASVSIRLGRPRAWLAAMAALTAVVVAHTAFRQLYYGQPLPNSFYLKLSGIPQAERLANGASFVVPFLSSHAPLLAGALYGCAADRRREMRLLAALPLVALAYQVWIGGDPWPYWRFLAPAMPALLILSAGTALTVAPRPWAVLAFVMAFLLADRPFLPELLFLVRPFQVMENESNVNVALAIDALTGPEASVGGCWSGAIPYYTGRRAVDFLGKSDARVARLPPDLSGSVSWARMRSVPGHNKYDLEYSIRQLRPTWVERFQWGRHDLRDWGRDHYESVDYRGRVLYLRKGAPEVRWRDAWRSSR